MDSKAPASLYLTVKKRKLTSMISQDIMSLFYSSLRHLPEFAQKNYVQYGIILASYAQMNAQVLGISVDSVFTLAKFKEEQGFNFPLLSDFNKEASADIRSRCMNRLFLI